MHKLHSFCTGGICFRLVPKEHLGQSPCNDRVRCAKRTLPWASAGREPARKCAPCPEPFPGICDRASAIRTPPCRPVRLSERTHRTWLEERRGRQEQRQSRKVRGAPLAHHTSRGGLRGWRKPPFVFWRLLRRGSARINADQETKPPSLPNSFFIRLRGFLCHNPVACWRFTLWSRCKTNCCTRDCISVSANF
jgi:hypothetical protein